MLSKASVGRTLLILSRPSNALRHCADRPDSLLISSRNSACNKHRLKRRREIDLRLQRLGPGERGRVDLHRRPEGRIVPLPVVRALAASVSAGLTSNAAFMLLKVSVCTATDFAISIAAEFASASFSAAAVSLAAVRFFIASTAVALMVSDSVARRMFNGIMFVCIG